MTQPPDETPDFLAKPVPPSGDQPTQPLQPPQPPTYGAPAAPGGPAGPSPYVSGPPPPAGYGQPSGQPGYGQPEYGQPGYGQPGYAPYGPGYPFAQAHNGANVAMGLGITSVVCALAAFVCCVTIPGVLTGPFAIVMAVRARSQMAASPGLYNNEGAAMTGLITGIIGTVVGVAVVAVVAIFFGFVFSFGGYDS